MWTTTPRQRRRRRTRWPAASTVLAAAIVAVASTPDEPPHPGQGPQPAHRGDSPGAAPPAFAATPPVPTPPHQDSASAVPDGVGTPDRVIPVAHGNGIPGPVLAAYQRATDMLRASQPGCRLPLALLAAIGKIETGHARGGQLDAAGTTPRPILGPALDGFGGLAAIPDTDGGRYDADTRWDRAVGPMQFIPGTWARWASDGNADRRADPHNIYDASLASGRYLCAGGRDLATDAGARQAILSYNHSTSYLTAVLAWMSAYSNGTVAIPTQPGHVEPRATEPVHALAQPAGTTPTQPPPRTPATTGPQPHPQPDPPPEPPPPAPPPSPQPPDPLPALACGIGDLLDRTTGLVGALLGQPPVIGISSSSTDPLRPSAGECSG